MDHTSKKGLITALSCYIIWGLLPLYWALLNHVSPYNILAQRIIWSGVCMAIVVFGLHFKQFKKDFQLLKEQRSQLFLLLVAAVIISVNWFTYIWAIANNQVMNTSLGYYINPLFNVVLGVILFKEVLSIPKKLSVLIATIGIALLTYQVGSLPLVSMILAVSFGLYGAVKKKLLSSPFTSIAFEAWLLTPLALLYTTMIDNTVWSYFGTELVYLHAAHSLRSNYICSIGAILLWCATIAAQPTRLPAICIPYHCLVASHLLLW